MPRGGRPGGRRRGAEVGGCRDRHRADLGRAVEVVDDVAERVHETRREIAGQRRARERHEPQRRRVVARRALSAGSSSMRSSITGTATNTSRAVLRDQRERALADRSAARAPSCRRAAGSCVAFAKPHAWKHGAAITIVSLRAVGESFEERDRRADVRRARDERALRRSGRSRRQDDRAARACAGGRGGGPSACRRGEVVERAGAVGRGRVGSVQARSARFDAGRGRRAARTRRRARAAMARSRSMIGRDLRGGEAGVEVQRVRAELGQRAGDLEEVAMVAAQDADRVARDAHRSR